MKDNVHENESLPVKGFGLSVHKSGGAFSKINDMMKHFYFFTYWKKYLWGGIERWAGMHRNRDRRMKVKQPEQDPYFVRFYGIYRPWTRNYNPKSAAITTANGDK